MGVTYNLGGDHISVKASSVVKIKEGFVIFTVDGPIDLNVDITADLADVPLKYHEIFVNTLTAKYLNKVSYSDNPFSKCQPIKKRNWWEFWKPKYVEL